MKLFKICLAKTNLGKAKSYSEIPQESFFVQFVEFIHSQMNCNFLSKKIQRWFNDNSGKTERDFAFRFRGKESFNFMQSFPELIMMIFTNVTQADLKQRLAQIHYQCILLQKQLSFSVRVVDFDENLLQEMILTGTRLFKATCIFNQRKSPSLWTLCNAAPIHAKICFEKYNLGLGCNTMEGREQKHQSIAKYAENTTFQNRWSLIFRHEFIQLIYLRENGFDNVNYRKKVIPYVSEHCYSNCSNCLASIVPGQLMCFLCLSDSYKKVEIDLSK